MHADKTELMLLALVAVSALLSLGTWFALKLVTARVEAAEQTLMRRLAQLHAMQYSLLRQQGWSHEELKETFVAKEGTTP